MASTSVKNFILQQGYPEEPDSTYPAHFSALFFQPRVVGLLAALAILSQATAIFFALSLVLWWNVAFPDRNVFDLVYNRFLAAPRGRRLIAPAPGPRRFSQGMAATFMLAIAVSLTMHWLIATLIFEGLLILALMALLAGRFCMGSFVYHLLHGKVTFACSTLPWSRPPRQSSGSPSAN